MSHRHLSGASPPWASTIRMRASAFAPPISSHLSTWWARRSAEGVLVEVAGDKVCLSSSLCALSLSLAPSNCFSLVELCIWKSSASQKSPRTWKQMSVAKGVSDRASSKMKSTGLILGDDIVVFCNPQVATVDTLDLIWRTEHENNYQMKSKWKKSGVYDDYSHSTQQTVSDW